MKSLLLLSLWCPAALSATTNIPVTPESISTPSSITGASRSLTFRAGAVTVTIIPTQVVVGDATLTRDAPETIVGGTSVSLGAEALIIGSSTISFATSGSAPIYTIANQTFAVGPAGVGVAGTTISNNGPAVTLSGTPVSLGSFGLVFNGASTFTIPMVQPLQSVFAVGNQSVTEQYGQIVLTSTQAMAKSSVAATATPAGPAPTSSPSPSTGAAAGPAPTSSPSPSTAAAARTICGLAVAVLVLCASALIMITRE